MQPCCVLRSQKNADWGSRQCFVLFCCFVFVFDFSFFLSFFLDLFKNEAFFVSFNLLLKKEQYILFTVSHSFLQRVPHLMNPFAPVNLQHTPDTVEGVWCPAWDLQQRWEECQSSLTGLWVAYRRPHICAKSLDSKRQYHTHIKEQSVRSAFKGVPTTQPDPDLDPITMLPYSRMNL